MPSGRGWSFGAILRNLASSVSLPYYRRHRGRAVVLVATVAFGVSSVVATGALIASGLAAAGLGWGPGVQFADLRIANGFAGVPEGLIAKARSVPGVAGAEGVLVSRMRVLSGPNPIELVLIGIDLLEAEGVHDPVTPRQALQSGDALDFLTDLHAVAFPADLAEVLGLEVGSSLEVDLQGRRTAIRVAALFEVEPSSKAHLQHAVIADLPAAQRLVGRDGLVDAIFVRSSVDWRVEDVEQRLSAVVAESATVVRTDGSDPELDGLLFNIRLVLDVAGMVAFIVGALVIYNAVALSASQRKPVLDIVSSLGTARRDLMLLLAVESLGLGAVGSAIGIPLGVAQAWLMSSMFEQALSTLYAPISESPFVVSKGYVALATGLGLGVPLLATLLPARSAARVTTGLEVVSPRSERRELAFQAAWPALALLVLGFALPFVRWGVPGARGLATVVTVGDVAVLLGLGLALPLVLVLAAPLLRGTVRRSRSSATRLSVLAFVADPARTAAVVASIMIATSNVIVTLGVVSSIRTGVLGWIGSEQQADLLVTPRGAGVLVPAAPLIAPAVGEVLSRFEGIAQVDAIRLVAQPFRNRWVVIQARDPEVLAKQQPFSVVAGDLKTSAVRMQTQQVVIASEHFASKHHLGVGDQISLRTPSGTAEFEIGAIVVDYSGDLGTVLVARSTFEDLWRDHAVNAYQLWLVSGTEPTSARNDLEKLLNTVCDCLVLTSQDYNQRGADFVDSIFYSAYGLEGVAVLVLLFAITSFFAITLSERRREIALLRVIGATRRQLYATFLGEGLIIAALGGALGCGVGAFLAARLTHGAIRVGGGMSLPFRLPIEAVTVTMAVVVVTSMIAAVGPIARAVRAEGTNADDGIDS